MTDLRSVEGQINSFANVNRELRHAQGFYARIRKAKKDSEPILITPTFRRNITLALIVAHMCNVREYKNISQTGRPKHTHTHRVNNPDKTPRKPHIGRLFGTPPPRKEVIGDKEEIFLPNRVNAQQ